MNCLSWKNYLVFCLCLLTACNRFKHQLPEATGDLGTLVLVTDAKTDQQLKPQIEACFLKPVEHLPTAEPFFEVKHCLPETFYKHFSTHRVILALVSADQMEAYADMLEGMDESAIQSAIQSPDAKILSNRNVFAKYQHIVFLFGKDASDLQRKLIQAKTPLSTALMQFEIKNQHDELFADTAACMANFNSIKQNFGIGVKIPKAFVLKYHNQKTYWYELSTTENNTPKTIGLIIHVYPYTNLNALTYESIRTVRDTVMKHVVKGELPGTYMGTSSSTQYPTASIETIQVNGRLTKKVRGWWTIRGLSQAGPFIRYVVLDEPKQQLFAFEGFVYKPNIETKERDLRLIESIALSIE
ncbi:MAG: hypothetical protein RLZZ318_955 [Bacteroidota bacterium]